MKQKQNSILESSWDIFKKVLKVILISWALITALCICAVIGFFIYLAIMLVITF